VDAPRKGYAAMKQLLKKVRPDGVFCSSDPIAIGAMDAILDSGFQIPEDIALVGCGNLHYDASLKVSLSSIDQQVRKIGIRAAKLLLQVIETKNPLNVSQSILQPSLIIRDSSTRKRK
jgi:LacI family transcriptional regulator